MYVRADTAYDDAYLLDNASEFTLGIQGDALYCDIAAHSAIGNKAACNSAA